MVLQEPACGSKTLLQDMQEAYEKGLVSEEAITEAVERLMEVRIRLGMIKIRYRPSQSSVRMRIQEMRWWSAERVRRHRLSISVQKYQETILNIVSYML